MIRYAVWLYFRFTLSVRDVEELLVRQRTMLINAIRGHCAEFGIISPQGARRASDLIDEVHKD